MTAVLVAYASKRGSTAEIAGAVAETLQTVGLTAECIAVTDVDSLAAYDAVVLGSAVYVRHWQRDARHFLRRFEAELRERPLWVFSSGPVGEPDKDPDPSWLEPPRIVASAERLGARGHVLFGGRVPSHPHGPMERSLVVGTPAAYRDRRDWDEIRAWALGIARDLNG